MRPVHWIILAGMGLGLAGCTQHRVEVQPIKVEPIHLTIDVNVRVDRELDEFFDYKEPPPPITPPPDGAEPAPAQPDQPVAEPAPASPSTSPSPLSSGAAS